MATLQNLRDKVYDILRETENSNAYPLTYVDDLINSAETILTTTNPSKPDGSQIMKPELPFLNGDSFYTSVQDTFVSMTATIGGTELYVSDTTWFATSGYLFVEGNIIQYTGVTATQFTGITTTNGIEYAHNEGTRVSQLYELPTDFSYSLELRYNRQLALNFVQYDNYYKQLRQLPQEYTTRYYSADQDSSTYDYRFNQFYTIINSKFFLAVNVTTSDKLLHLRYQKKPIKMVDSTDEATIPDEYATHTIPYYATKDILLTRGEGSYGMQMWTFGAGKVKEMYNFYTKQQSEDTSNNRVKTGKDMRLNL